MAKDELEIIIPIDLTKCFGYRFFRLKQLLDMLSSKKFNIAVADSTRPHRLRNKIMVLSKLTNVKYMNVAPEEVCSPGRLRNFAAFDSDFRYLLFLDVDLLPHPKLLDSLDDEISELRKLHKNFTYFPCVYLGRTVSMNIEKRGEVSNSTFQIIKESVLKGTPDVMEHMAFATSTILITKQSFVASSGFDEGFVGHGLEDLDLLSRLMPEKHHHLCISRCKNRIPAKQKGFRAICGRHTLEKFFKDQFTIHLWHPRPLLQKYHRLRDVNEIRLKEKNDEFPYSSLFHNNFHSSDGCFQLGMCDDLEGFAQSVQAQYGFDTKSYKGLSIAPKITKSWIEVMIRKSRKFLLHLIAIRSN